MLDIGCGGGHLLEEIAKAVGPEGKAYGLDTSEDQLNQARKRCSLYKNVFTIKSYANQISLENNSCDSICSVQTFEYIENVDESIKELTRILKPSSIFVNISILWEYYKFFGADEELNKTIHNTFKAHCFHQMLPTSLEGKLKKFGFKILNINRYLCLLQKEMIILLLNLQRKSLDNLQYNKAYLKLKLMNGNVS